MWVFRQIWVASINSEWHSSDFWDGPFSVICSRLDNMSFFMKLRSRLLTLFTALAPRSTTAWLCKANLCQLNHITKSNLEHCLLLHNLLHDIVCRWDIFSFYDYIGYFPLFHVKFKILPLSKGFFGMNVKFIAEYFNFLLAMLGKCCISACR